MTGNPTGDRQRAPAAMTVVGGGRVGRSLVEQLRKRYPTTQLRLLDLRATELAARYPETFESVEARVADLSDERVLETALTGDIVINTAGPFFRHGSRVLEASIRSGKHYVDVCDESRPLEAMRALGERASTAGILAVVGCGFSPGFPNMIVGNLTRAGKRVKDAQIAWCTSMADPVGQAAALHALHIVTPPARHLSDGRLHDVQPLLASRSTEFPPPFGIQDAYDVEHSEPLTLSLAFDGLRSVWVGGTIVPNQAIRRLNAYAVLDLAEPTTIRIGDNDIARAGIVSALDKDFWGKTRLDPALPTSGSVVVAVCDEAGARTEFGLVGPMAQSTAAGAMAGVAAVLAKSGRSGVLFSEEIVEWHDYLDAVTAVGGIVYRRANGEWLDCRSDRAVS